MLNFRQKTPKNQTNKNKQTNKKKQTKKQNKQTKKPTKTKRKKQTNIDFAYFFLCYLLYFLLIWYFFLSFRLQQSR